ncbi:MAG: hypothetical protein WA056_05345 [Gallionella sp.]
MNKRPDPKVIGRACYEALSALGIHKKYGIGILTIEENFMGWIGLNQGVHPTFVRVNPNIGIHSIPLMKLVADAAGEKYRSGEYPTLGYPLGEACPKVKQFIFETEADVLPEAARLADTIGQYGIPYIRSLASYGEMLPRIRKEVASLGGAPERYAAALYLSGDVEGAFNFLNEQAAIFVGKRFNNEAEKLNRLKRYFEAR